MKLSIIIPCYNEQHGIAALAEVLAKFIQDARARDVDVEVILVNDGSTDNTQMFLEKEFGDDPVYHIASYGSNRGVGGAIKEGFAKSASEILVCYESDCTYSIDKVWDLLARIQEGADVASISPYHPGGGMQGVPILRLLLSIGVSWLYRLAFLFHPQTIYTFSGIFRAYRKEALEDIHVEADGFLFGAEIMCRFLKKGYRVAEVPAILYVRRRGQSSLNLPRMIRTIFQHLAFIGKMICTPNERREE